MCEALDDFTEAICLDPRHVVTYELRVKRYSRYDPFQNVVQDSEMVIKLNPKRPNAYCNVGFANYALGNDNEGAR